MMRLEALSIFVTAIFIFAANCDSATERFTLRREDYRLKDSSITEEHECTTLMACISICNHLDWCKSASFNPVQGRCLSSRTRVTHGGPANTHLTAEINWITMSKAIFTVFQTLHSDGSYQASYQDAVTLCNEKNTVIASEADLLASRALGMNFCACGWLSNQRNGMVLQSPDPCSGSYNESVIYCDRDKANAWCRL